MNHISFSGENRVTGYGLWVMGEGDGEGGMREKIFFFVKKFAYMIKLL